MEKTIAPVHATQLSGKLDTVFSQVQKEQSVIVPSVVRGLIEAVISESILLRKDEWVKKYDFDLDDPTGLEMAIDRAAQTVYTLLKAVPSEVSEGGESLNYLSLVGTLRQIHIQWCGIFPFCRPR